MSRPVFNMGVEDPEWDAMPEEMDLSRLWDGVALWVALERLERVGLWRLDPSRVGQWMLVVLAA